MVEKMTGRITRSISGFYDVQTPKALVTCRARGILRKEGNSPLTGDMVEITVERSKGMVERILPRKNSFVRPAVANVDALVVFAANVNPVTEPFLIDRVAAIAGDQEVQVILCVNKCDLDPAVDLVRIYEHAGFTVICKQNMIAAFQGLDLNIDLCVLSAANQLGGSIRCLFKSKGIGIKAITV